MEAFKAETTVAADRTVLVRYVPFQAGARVQVTVAEPTAAATNSDSSYPLRGRKPYRYDAPFEPLDPDAWDALP